MVQATDPTESLAKGAVSGVAAGAASAFVFPPLAIPLGVGAFLLHSLADWNERQERHLEIDEHALISRAHFEQERLEMEKHALISHAYFEQERLEMEKHALMIYAQMEAERNQIIASQFGRMNDIQYSRNVIEQERNELQAQHNKIRRDTNNWIGFGAAIIAGSILLGFSLLGASFVLAILLR